MEWSIIWDYRAVLWSGLLLTIRISFLSAIGAVLLGTFLSCVRQLPNYYIQRAVDIYVEVIRNIPSVVKIFFFYFVTGLNAIQSAVVALALHQSAYLCDILASGFRSVPREQSEAAWACGHSRSQIFIQVLLPQVLAAVIPPLASQFIEIVKNSAAAMLLGVQELTFQTQRINLDTFRGFEAASIVTVLYVLLALTIAIVMSAIERKVQWQ